MKKGFTLIELLAVIVILAIIALIAVPIILGIINDARESAKTRSAELVYKGVEYAYTASMYQIPNITSDISIQTIYDNFNVSNVSKGTRPGDNDTSFEVETNDGLTCLISTGINGFDVKCGTDEDDDKYFDKTVITDISIPSFMPQAYSYLDAEEIDVEDSLPAGTTTNPSRDIDSNFYLGHDIDQNNNITVNYACFVTNKEYCLKYGHYNDNIQIMTQVFGTSACTFTGSSTIYYSCTSSSLNVEAGEDGSVSAGYDLTDCFVRDDGSSVCRTMQE